MAKIRANDHYVPAVADPLAPDHVRQQDQGADVHGLPVDRRADGRPLPRPGRSTSAGRNRKWFTFTNGTHVDSLDPETFNRWYDFLQLYVAQAGADRELRGHPRRRAGDLPGGDGDHGRDDAARPDPAAAHLRDRAGGVRAAAVDPRPVRQRRRRPAAGPPAPRLRALVAELPDPGHHGAVLVPGARRRARRRPARAAGRGLVHLERPRAAADRLHRRHRGGHRRPLDRHAALPVDAEPGGQRRVLPDRAR